MTYLIKIRHPLMNTINWSQQTAHKISRNLVNLNSTMLFRINQLLYARKLPSVSSIGRRIIRELADEGVSIVKLGELSLESNPSFDKAIDKLVKDLEVVSPAAEKEYKLGFKHCTPINPSQIARDYPEVFLWGLDHDLLDIVENLIGVPVAYHGVVARKEIVDDQLIGTRVWHLDDDDINVVRIHVYLSDVLNEDSGAFEYIPKKLSPSYRAFKGRGEILDEHMGEVIAPSQWKKCLGEAKTVIFANTSSIFHHGSLPKEERMVASFTYTSQNPANEEICRAYSFEPGMHLIDTSLLTERQRYCLWKYM